MWQRLGMWPPAVHVSRAALTDRDYTCTNLTYLRPHTTPQTHTHMHGHTKGERGGIECERERERLGKEAGEEGLVAVHAARQ